MFGKESGPLPSFAFVTSLFSFGDRPVHLKNIPTSFNTQQSTASNRLVPSLRVEADDSDAAMEVYRASAPLWPYY